MKKIVISFLALSTLLISCNSTSIEKGNYEMSIFIASDLHLLSSNYFSVDNSKYTKDVITSDGRVQEKDYELVYEFVKQVNINKPSYVLLTGDLSFNGEKDSHVELINILNEINEDTKVLVIPGNHDTYSTNAVSFIDDKKSSISSIDTEEFKDLYANFGYNDAYSYDEKTLSYIYELSEDKWVLMLDTTLSRFNYEYEYNFVSGQLFDSTLSWIEENLSYAKDHDIEVISATHHNLITVKELFESNYTLYDSEKILQMYVKYGVKLNFSGHLHVQSIKEYYSKEGSLIDIASNSLLDYGNRYGVLDIYDNCYEYNAIKCIPFDGFEEYSFNVFYDKYYNKSIKTNNSSFGDYGDDITDFIAKANCYYFDGNYTKIHNLIKQNRKLYRKIKRASSNNYQMSLFNVENINQHYLILEK